MLYLPSICYTIHSKGEHRATPERREHTMAKYKFTSKKLGTKYFDNLNDCKEFAESKGFTPRNVSDGWKVKHFRFFDGIELSSEDGYEGAWIYSI